MKNVLKPFKLAIVLLFIFSPSWSENSEGDINQKIGDAFKIDSELSKEYFLSFTFDEIIVRLDGVRHLSSGTFKRNWYATHLNALKEKSLISRLNPNTFYFRFLWLRAFHNPVSIRVEIEENKNGTLYFVMADGAGGYEPGTIIKSYSRELTESEKNILEERIKDASLCTSAVEKTPGFDGAQWIFERRQGNNYCVSDNWSPKDNQYTELGLYLLRLSDFEEADDQPIY